MTIKFAIITCSDTRTLETDEAGQKLEQLIAEQGWECVRRVVEMDERPFIAGALIDACDTILAGAPAERFGTVAVHGRTLPCCYYTGENGMQATLIYRDDLVR